MKFLLTRSGKPVLKCLDVDIKFSSIGDVSICVCTCISTLMTILHTYPAGQYRKSNELISANTVTVTDRDRNVVIHIRVSGTI
jgi:hypothetical protein